MKNKELINIILDNVKDDDIFYDTAKIFVNLFNDVFNNPDKNIDDKLINDVGDLRQYIVGLLDILYPITDNEKIREYIYSNHENADAILVKIDKYIEMLEKLNTALDLY